MLNKKELWCRLRSYHFDHLVPTVLWQHIAANFGGPNAFSKAFASKIARKHEWKKSFALKAIEEYKKFVYLGIISKFQVTPSKIIDIVWHEHLLFTKGYRQFCAEVIEYEFDHYPELVPLTEQTEQFNTQYLQTLELYKTEFGIAPPAAIWETTKYDKKQVAYQSAGKKENERCAEAGGAYITDAPLYSFFDSQADAGFSNTEFGGGDFGGAGASGGWSDSGDSGSGSDMSSDGGSSCSSGCSSCGGGD